MLSEEVEVLSQKNEKLLRDLGRREYYQEYYRVQNELEKLQLEYCELVDTFQIIS